MLCLSSWRTASYLLVLSGSLDLGRISGAGGSGSGGSIEIFKWELITGSDNTTNSVAIMHANLHIVPTYQAEKLEIQDNRLKLIKHPPIQCPPLSLFHHDHSKSPNDSINLFHACNTLFALCLVISLQQFQWKWTRFPSLSILQCCKDFFCCVGTWPDPYLYGEATNNVP